MLRLLLVILTFASGCSCGSSTSSPDAGMLADGGVTDSGSVFVDARHRDASLPCEGTVALLRADTSSLPPAYQRSQVRAAREGDGLVLSWFNADETGGGQWLIARVREPDAPRPELVDSLPLPGLVGLYTNELDGVRVVMTEAAHPRDGVSRGAWADLQPDGTFGDLHPFERPPDLPPLGSGSPCAGMDAAVLYLCSSAGQLGATILSIDPAGASFFEPAFSMRFGSCGAGDRVTYGPAGCVGSRGVTSALIIGHDATEPPAVVEWRPDGALLHADAVPLGTAGGQLEGIAAADDSGPIYFVLAGSPSPRASAYRIVGEEAVTLDEAALDAFPDPVAKPLGAVRLAEGRWLLAYVQSDVLSVIAFDEGDGFGSPVIVASGGFSGRAPAVQIGSKVYLPLGGLWLLRACGEA